MDGLRNLDGTNYVVITTINKPSKRLRNLFYRLNKNKKWTIIIVGDINTPPDWEREKYVFYLSIEKQKEYFPKISRLIPIKHYSRKNLGYLYAIIKGAETILDLDDDNFIYKDADIIFSKYLRGKLLISQKKWVNVYKYFTNKLIWPRGLPLEYIHNFGKTINTNGYVICPIQQFVVDGDPDVDAIYRIMFPKQKIIFKKNLKPLIPDKFNWTPFNSQCTLFFKEAFPVLYLPCYLNFRLVDIWRAFVAQSVLWVKDFRLAFREPIGQQIRNKHNLANDFHDEIKGYIFNGIIAEKIEKQLMTLDGRDMNIAEISKRIWEMLIDSNYLPNKEKEIINAWYEIIQSVIRCE
jgi:hypothetical protein